MTTFQYQCALSLDGFLAGPGGDMQWMNDVEPVPSPMFDNLAARVDVILCGARTHRGDDPNAGTDSEGAYGGTYDGQVVVLTHHPDPEPADGVGVGGEAGVLDEVLVLVLPVMLGDGVRLLDRPGGEPVRLEVVAAEGLGLHARVVR